MKQLLQKGLQATEALFAQVRPLFALLLQEAQVLSNKEQAKAEEVRTRFEDVLTQMRAHAEQSEAGRSALMHFLKVTQSYAPHLFFCYQIGAGSDQASQFGFDLSNLGRKGVVQSFHPLMDLANDH